MIVRSFVDYDELNRLTAVKENGSTSLAAYTYDAASRRSGLSYGNSTSAAYAYAANSDLKSVENIFSGSSVAFGYSYNHVHQNTQVQVSDSTYVLHPASATSISYTPDDVNQYTAVASATPTFDGNGNLTGDGVNSFTYDTENRLLSFSKTGHSASYVYDPLGRRGSKTVDSVTTAFLSAGSQEIAEYDGSGNLARRYIFGPGIDEPMLRIDCSGTGCSTATKYFNHQDGLGSVVALTDASGAVTETDTYSPYGESATTAGNSFRFAGMRLDAETGLYYDRARYYSPALGRFLSNDPIGYAGGKNLYVYAGNDPLNRVDPPGLTSELLINGGHRAGSDNGIIPQGYGTSIPNSGSQLSSTIVSTFSSPQAAAVSDYLSREGESLTASGDSLMLAGTATSFAGVVTLQPEITAGGGTVFGLGAGATFLGGVMKLGSGLIDSFQQGSGKPIMIQGISNGISEVAPGANPEPTVRSFVNRYWPGS